MRRLLVGLVSLPLVVWLLTGVAEIRPEERAVVKRFGRIVAKPRPGLWIGLPAGIDRVERVPMAVVRRVTVGFSLDGDNEDLPTPPGQLLTGDRNLVNVQIHIDYRVGESEEALEDFVMQRDRIEPVLERLTESTVAEWVAGHKVDEVLLTGNASLPGWVLDRVQPVAEDEYRLGIRITQVTVSYLQPPEAVRSAFEDVNRAQNTMRTQVANASQEAARRLQRADSERLRMELLAAQSQRSTLEQAQADSRAFIERTRQYHTALRTNPRALDVVWWAETEKLVTRLAERRSRVVPLDSVLGADGMNITIPPPPRNR